MSKALDKTRKENHALFLLAGIKSAMSRVAQVESVDSGQSGCIILFVDNCIRDIKQAQEERKQLRKRESNHA